MNIKQMQNLQKQVDAFGLYRDEYFDACTVMMPKLLRLYRAIEAARGNIFWNQVNHEEVGEIENALSDLESDDA